MDLNLTYKLILIALDDKDGKFITDTAHLHYGIAGSVLLELALQKRIALKDDNVLLTNKDKTTSPCLNNAIKLISESKEPRSVQHWINIIGLGAEQIKDITIEHLTEENVLRKDAGKILWIIPTTKFPTEDPFIENEIRELLLDIVINGKESEIQDLMLLSLIEESELLPEVFRSKQEIKKAKKYLKQINDEILAKQTDKGINSLHMAVKEGIMSAIVNSTTVNTTSD